MADEVAPRLKRAYEIKKDKAVIAYAAKKASAKMAEQQKNRLFKTKIDAIEIASGKVFLQLEGGSKNIPSTTLTKYHYIEGVGVKGIQGLISNDFSFQSGSTRDVKYDTAEANLAFAVPKTISYVYSQANATSVRPIITKDTWTRQLANFAKNKINGRKLTYEDMPHWDSEFNPNRAQWFGVTTNDPAPTSYDEGVDGLNQDDVDWYYSLKLYAEYCEIKYQTAIKERQAALDAYNIAAGLLGQPKITLPTKDASTSKSTTTTTSKTDDKQSSGNLSGIGDDTKPVIHNLPAVKEMYFRSDDLQNFKVNSGNLSKRVDEAKKLWADSSSYKGMIQSFIVPAQLNGNTWWNPAGEKGLQGNNKRINTRRYGFQFQYNPSTVTMAYAGAPQVDIGLETSGADKVPLIGSSVTSSTVTFQLLINRMNDFKYLDSLIYDTSESRYIEAVVPTRGKVKLNNLSSLFGEVYSHTGNHPVQRQNAGAANEVSSINDELIQIKELGTMYDIEYLLRTLLGYQLKSNLRNVFTSDIGYLGAYPVELHLGNNLRYLGVIDGFNVSHTIFNQNMVPVFSNVSITFSRLPDFAKPFNEVTVVDRGTVDTGKEDN